MYKMFSKVKLGELFKSKQTKKVYIAQRPTDSQEDLHKKLNDDANEGFRNYSEYLEKTETSTRDERIVLTKKPDITSIFNNYAHRVTLLAADFTHLLSSFKNVEVSFNNGLTFKGNGEELTNFQKEQFIYGHENLTKISDNYSIISKTKSRLSIQASIGVNWNGAQNICHTIGGYLPQKAPSYKMVPDRRQVVRYQVDDGASFQFTLALAESGQTQSNRN